MLGPLQAKPLCFCEHLSQALGPHGSSLPCAAPGAALYEAVPLVDKTLRDPLDRTCLLPSKGVAQLPAVVVALNLEADFLSRQKLRSGESESESE